MHGHDLLIDSEPEANRRCVIGSHRRRRLVIDRFLKNGKISAPTANVKSVLLMSSSPSASSHLAFFKVLSRMAVLDQF